MAKLHKMQDAPAKPESPTNSLEVRFVRDRDTKNTVRYNEVGEPFEHKIGALYVQKTALREMRDATGAWPATLTVLLVVG